MTLGLERVVEAWDADGRPLGFQVGKVAALAEWRDRRERREFSALCVRLSKAAWDRQHPSEKHARQARYGRKAEVRAGRNARARQKRAQRPLAVLACRGCGVRFERKRRGRRPLYCSIRCAQRYRYHQRRSV